MRPYDLAAIARKGARKGQTLLPVIKPSYAIGAGYQRVLYKFVRGIARAADNVLVASYRNDRRAQAVALADVSPEDYAEFERVVLALRLATIQQIRAISAAEASRHTTKFIALARTALGVDLAGIVQTEDLAPYLEAAATRHANLIVDVDTQLVNKVKNRVINASIQGKSIRALKAEIQKDTGFSRTRVARIARDQSHKFTSELSQIRHTQAGVKKYVWRTALDERVRLLHVSLNGREYRYGQSTGAEGGLPPGQPIECRCIAQGIVKFD